MIRLVAVVTSDNKVEVFSMDEDKSMVLNCTLHQFIDGRSEYERGCLIQDAFSFLSDDEREFLLSGMLPSEWDEMCAAFEEEGDEIDPEVALQEKDDCRYAERMSQAVEVVRNTFSPKWVEDSSPWCVYLEGTKIPL